MKIHSNLNERITNLNEDHYARTHTLTAACVYVCVCMFSQRRNVNVMINAYMFDPFSSIYIYIGQTESEREGEREREEREREKKKRGRV